MRYLPDLATAFFSWARTITRTRVTASSCAPRCARSPSKRAVVALERSGRAPNPAVRVYLNRLSDLLFVLARRQANEDEPVSR